MRDIPELVTLYEQGLYTFAEVVTAIVCEARARHPADMAGELPENFLASVEESACSVPETATADDVVVFKSSRAHAQPWLDGAATWRRYFAGRATPAA